MKELLVCVIGFLLFVGILCGAISYNSYINRNKEHVYTAEEVFAIECAKRGGNPSTKTGNDYAGEQNTDTQEFKCEGAQ